MDQTSMEPPMNQPSSTPEKKSVGPIIGIAIIIIIIILGALFIYGGSVRKTTEPDESAATAAEEALELQNISTQSSSDDPESILEDLKMIQPENLGAGLENL